MNAKLLFVHALSPLHAGTGQGVGVIDLPIAREKATGLPYLPGSSLKGTLRDSCSDKNKDLQLKIFGPETANASDHAGSAQFSDQRLLLLPIRSLRGTFAWVTSPYLLRRLARDAQGAGETLPAVPIPADDKRCIVASQKCALLLDQKQVILEELDLARDTSQNSDQWAGWLAARLFPDNKEWQAFLAERLCIVHDDSLSFLLDTATEITARIKLLDDAKTVEQGGLWYEESLPAETVLTGLLVATPVKKSDLEAKRIFETIGGLLEKPIQFGGKATVGRGLCQVRLG